MILFYKIKKRGIFMKKIFAGILLIASSLLSYSNELDKSNINRVILTKEVVDREPGEEVQKFNLYSQGYLYAEFIDIGEEKEVFFNWYLLEDDGEKTLMASVPLTIKGNRWRTWSSKNLFLSGKWAVEIVDKDDNVLSTTEFIVD
jgi:hypothetical protein